MSNSTQSSDLSEVFDISIGKICGYYQVEEGRVRSKLEPLAAHFQNYCEMAFSTDGFEFITTGTGIDFMNEVSRYALSCGLSVETVNLFAKCFEQFPDAHLGIKFSFGEKMVLPTIYVRSMTRIDKSFDFLQKHIADIESLKEAMHENQIMYGLGFTEKQGQPYIKTYSINSLETGHDKTQLGFISHRLQAGKLLNEYKTYLPDIALPQIYEDYPSIRQLTEFLIHDMKYKIAGHIGAFYQDDKISSYKIYIEKIGGIPTDFSAQ
jgi:hypothetical protein